MPDKPSVVNPALDGILVVQGDETDAVPQQSSHIIVDEHAFVNELAFAAIDKLVAPATARPPKPAMTWAQWAKGGHSKRNHHAKPGDVGLLMREPDVFPRTHLVSRMRDAQRRGKHSQRRNLKFKALLAHNARQQELSGDVHLREPVVRLREPVSLPAIDGKPQGADRWTDIVPPWRATEPVAIPQASNAETQGRYGESSLVPAEFATRHCSCGAEPDEPHAVDCMLRAVTRISKPERTPKQQAYAAFFINTMRLWEAVAYGAQWTIAGKTLPLPKEQKAASNLTLRNAAYLLTSACTTAARIAVTLRPLATLRAAEQRIVT